MTDLPLNQILCGDCLEVMKGWPDGCVDAIVTDPPFAFAGGLSNGRSSFVDGQFFTAWWRGICNEWARVTKQEGEGFVWCDWRTAGLIAQGFTPQVQGYDYWRVPQMLYHYREMPGQGQPFRNSVDLIAYARGPKSKGRRIPNTTRNWISKYWYYGKHEFHPAEKDVDICKQLIEWCSDPGDVVVDLCCGSGTTCLAAKQLGRNFIGIDISEDYCRIARERLKQDEPLFAEAV